MGTTRTRLKHRSSSRAEPDGVLHATRRGFARDDIHKLRRAYRLLFANEGTLKERVDDVALEFATHPIVQEIVAFIRVGGKRSLCTPRDGAEG